MALARVLKNYSAVTLLWVLPLGFLLTVVRLLFLTLGRRFEEAYELLAAAGWNVTHLGGTVRRRRVAQRARTVRDHALRHFTACAGLHIPRWFQTAERILEEQRELGEGEADQPVSQRLRHRTASFVSVHPVLVGCFVAAIVGAFASARSSRRRCSSGCAAGVPRIAERVSSKRWCRGSGDGARWIGRGEPGPRRSAASPWPRWRTRRWPRRRSSSPVPPSPPSWRIARSFDARAARVRRLSRRAPTACRRDVVVGVGGRIALLFVLAVLPPLVERVDAAFAAAEPSDGRWRFTVGLR